MEMSPLPRGFYIKTGMYTLEWETRPYVTLGEDKLVEQIHYTEIPKVQTPWITFGLNIWKLHVSYRIRPWTSNIFRWGWGNHAVHA